MISRLKDVWYVRAPAGDQAVKVTCTSQTTDDEWYKLEVVQIDDSGRLSPNGYPLRTKRLPRNVGEVRYSLDGLTLVALEFDGSVVVWRKSATGCFDRVGEHLDVGGPIHGLEVGDSGNRFSVQMHPKGLFEFVRNGANGFVSLGCSVD